MPQPSSHPTPYVDPVEKVAQLVADLAVEIDAIEHRAAELSQPLASSLGTACRVARDVIELMSDELNATIAGARR